MTVDFTFAKEFGFTPAMVEEMSVLEVEAFGILLKASDDKTQREMGAMKNGRRGR